MRALEQWLKAEDEVDTIDVDFSQFGVDVYESGERYIGPGPDRVMSQRQLPNRRRSTQTYTLTYRGPRRLMDFISLRPSSDILVWLESDDKVLRFVVAQENSMLGKQQLNSVIERSLEELRRRVQEINALVEKHNATLTK